MTAAEVLDVLLDTGERLAASSAALTKSTDDLTHATEDFVQIMARMKLEAAAAMSAEQAAWVDRWLREHPGYGWLDALVALEVVAPD